MPIDNLEEMIVRQMDNNLTESEGKELNDWYNSSEENKKLYKDYCVLLKARLIASDKRLFENDKTNSWNRLRKRIWGGKTKTYRISALRYAAVATVALLIGLGGRNLFLSNAITKDTLIEVPSGSKSRIVLPDGTSVWLNSSTKLTYTEDFGKTNRTIYLDGEGYFEVTKNKQLPFEVHAGKARIRVLGTRFDMKAYSTDEKNRVTLLEGSLSIAMNSDKEIIIVPNEQAVITKGNSNIKVRQVKADDYALWTEAKKETVTSEEPKIDKKLPRMQIPNQTFRNTLFFDEEPLSQIARDLGRAFNVMIELGTNDIAADVYYGDFRNEESIYQILDVITSSGDIYYEVKDNKIVINKYNIRN